MAFSLEPETSRQIASGLDAEIDSQRSILGGMKNVIVSTTSSPAFQGATSQAVAAKFEEVAQAVTAQIQDMEDKVSQIKAISVAQEDSEQQQQASARSLTGINN